MTYTEIFTDSSLTPEHRGHSQASCLCDAQIYLPRHMAMLCRSHHLPSSQYVYSALVADHAQL